MTLLATGVPYAIVPSLLTVGQAQALVLAHVRPLGAETVSLWEAAGRVTAEPLRAAVDLPPFPSSAMDGYAVRADDLPGRLVVVDQVRAGAPVARALAAGEAMAMSTGGVVPDGANAVAPIEIVVKLDNEIEIEHSLEPGAHVRPRGGDVSAGDIVVPACVRLGAAQLGAAAAAGIPEAICARRPRVAILATGSELVPPGATLEAGQIYDSNGLMLATALAASGAEVETMPAVADDESSHRAALERGLAADVLVTTGGVSVGPHDLVRGVERDLGVEEVFWQVAMRPGKPVSFGVRGATLVFGLPGNPVSSLVGCELFVKPALRALQGLERPLPNLESGRLATALSRNAMRDDFVRARLRVQPDEGRPGEVLLEPLRGQESHMIVRAAAADGLVVVPRGEGELEAGAAVGWIRLGAG